MNENGANGASTMSLEEQLRASIDMARSAKAKPTFCRAVKRDQKLRLALSGPAGSGKTYTLLKLATELGGPIAIADTEHGSASKYADLFTFDVVELSSFDPLIIPELIQQAAAHGYRSLLIDSLSHFWNGVDGELDQVDKITARSKSSNSWAAWRSVSPKHNAMVDAMTAAPIHVLCSMRSMAKLQRKVNLTVV